MKEAESSNGSPARVLLLVLTSQALDVGRRACARVQEFSTKWIGCGVGNGVSEFCGCFT